MADWYVSSAAYATYAAFQGSTLYHVGDIIVPTAPANAAKWVLRCTTQGTTSTEPSWNNVDNGTSTSGTAVFTNVTGQGAYFWTTAAGDLATLLQASVVNRIAAGDRAFISSDHSETQTVSTIYGSPNTTGSGTYDVVQYLCVDRTGSTPPVAADLRTGATLTVSGTGVAMSIAARNPAYHYGIAFIQAATGNSQLLVGVTATGARTCYLDTCSLNLNNNSTTSTIQVNRSAIFDNTTVQFSNVNQFITTAATSTGELSWFNTANAVLGTIPTTLFRVDSAAPLLVTCRGIDLSAVTTILAMSGKNGGKYLFESCKIANAVTRYSVQAASGDADEVMLINCHDGSNILAEYHSNNGDVTTEFVITLSGGPADNAGTFAHKMVSNANIDMYAHPLRGFWMDQNYTSVGTSKTATVEIISSVTLNNNDIALYLEYEGTVGSSIASFTDSLITVLTTPSAVTSSTATWNASPATPVKQKLQVTFTPQTPGRLRGQVRLGKSNTTVYYNPQIVIT